MLKKVAPVLIILLVVLISIAVMFLPTLFTKGVSRVSMNKKLTLPLVLKNKENIEIIFFGYSGCIDVCTPRLESLATFYKALNQDIQEKVAISFFDISKPIDTTLPQRFTESFHKKFRGIYLEESILRDYTKAFGVYFAQSLVDSTEFDHTPNLYIVKRVDQTKTLRFVYTTYPYDFKQIRADIKELINE